jgi:hypothetical protein
MVAFYKKQSFCLLIAILFFIVLIFIPVKSDARQGCCSHHGGVCGCKCCDGTSLSSTCRISYPECKTGGYQNNQDFNNKTNLAETSGNADYQDSQKKSSRSILWDIFTYSYFGFVVLAIIGSFLDLFSRK